MKIIMVGAGLAGIGKTVYLTRLASSISASTPCVYFDKDEINIELGQGYDSDSEYYRTTITPQTYQIIVERARQPSLQGKVVILDGY
ncbi:MAG: hypothetical protein A3E87_08795 [Gammaproteobacteria bacterium RIFCSPHIGHO2_12_FULL_35_23]|nr:MAG: hypothetical protein A3E87_08795 [Gammaproteobacteria bacterium RIFCSPHIGHO2_12_FULL_35_23]